MAEDPHAQRFRFTGTAGECFRVWIVNLLLTVVPLGSYGPWTRVRKRRWLYGHTWIAGSNFDFHGHRGARAGRARGGRGLTLGTARSRRQ